MRSAGIVQHDTTKGASPNNVTIGTDSSTGDRLRLSSPTHNLGDGCHGEGERPPHLECVEADRGNAVLTRGAERVVAENDLMQPFRILGNSFR